MKDPMNHKDNQGRSYLALEECRVRVGRIECVVQVFPPSSVSSAELINEILRDFPRLADHTCVNGWGECFSAVMQQTSLPHLLEHLIIEIQLHTYQKQNSSLQRQETTSKRLTFTGATHWNDTEQTHATVAVSFIDDLVALRALRDALAYLNAKLEGRAL